MTFVLSPRVQSVHDELCCPACRHGLQDGDSGCVCTACGASYSTIQGVLALCAPETLEAAKRFEKADSENTFKNRFKRWPVFYEFATHLLTPVLFGGLTMRRFLTRFPSGKGLKILNVGAGPSRLHPDEIGVDVFPFAAVDMLADGSRLPFSDGTFDITGSEQVLEHVPNPKDMVCELIRVTKPGGLVYIGIPFMYPYHPSPKDYTRWSFDGLEEMTRPCIKVEQGIMAGPTSGALSMVGVWLSILFSFGIAPLQKGLIYIFWILLSPLKLLDYFLVYFPGAASISCAIYMIVRVPDDHILV